MQTSTCSSFGLRWQRNLNFILQNARKENQVFTGLEIAPILGKNSLEKDGFLRQKSFPIPAKPLEKILEIPLATCSTRITPLTQLLISMFYSILTKDFLYNNLRIGEMGVFALRKA